MSYVVAAFQDGCSCRSKLNYIYCAICPKSFVPPPKMGQFLRDRILLGNTTIYHRGDSGMNICEHCINNEVCPNDTNLIYQVNVNGHTRYECPDEIWELSKLHAKWREEHEGNTFVRLVGCDDTTEFTMELSDDEFVFLRKVAEKANKTSTYGCMPTMDVKPIKRKV